MGKRENKIVTSSKLSEIDKIRFEKEFVPLTNYEKVIRYSDDDLQEFKNLVLSKLEEAENDYILLKGTLARTNNTGAADTSPTYKLSEDAADVFSKEEIAQLALRQLQFIETLQNALVRIENKTYGICRVSGQLIAKERLRAVPHTTMSMGAKLEISRLN